MNYQQLSDWVGVLYGVSIWGHLHGENNLFNLFRPAAMITAPNIFTDNRYSFDEGVLSPKITGNNTWFTLSKFSLTPIPTLISASYQGNIDKYIMTAYPVGVNQIIGNILQCQTFYSHKDVKKTKTSSKSDKRSKGQRSDTWNPDTSLCITFDPCRYSRFYSKKLVAPIEVDVIAEGEIVVMWHHSWIA